MMRARARVLWPGGHGHQTVSSCSLVQQLCGFPQDWCCDDDGLRYPHHAWSAAKHMECKCWCRDSVIFAAGRHSCFPLELERLPHTDLLVVNSKHCTCVRD